MTKRYFVPDLAETGGSVALPPTEAQHATGVMRVKVGDDVELFNGLGLQAAARIIEIGRNRCVCGTEHATLVDRDPNDQSTWRLPYLSPSEPRNWWSD